MARSVHARTHSVEERDDGSESPMDAESGSDAEDQDLFVREEKPMKFFFYDISEDRVEALTEKIEARCFTHLFVRHDRLLNDLQPSLQAHGGRVTSLENKATIILVTKRKHYDVLKFKYDIVKDKWVHMSGWVDQCIERKKVMYPRPQFRNMGGTTAPKQGNSAPRRSPVAFTEEDRLNLCRWIATKVPYKNDGGRNGNKIYKELVERVSCSYNASLTILSDLFSVVREVRPVPLGSAPYVAGMEAALQDEAGHSGQNHRQLVEQDPPDASGKGQHRLKRRRVGMESDDSEVEPIRGEEDTPEPELANEIESEDEGNAGGGAAREGEGVEQREEEEEEEEEEGEEFNSDNWENLDSQVDNVQAGQKRRRSSGTERENQQRDSTTTPAKRQKTTAGKRARWVPRKDHEDVYEGAHDEGNFAPEWPEHAPDEQVAPQKTRPRPRPIAKGKAPAAPDNSQMTLVNPTQPLPVDEESEEEEAAEPTPKAKGKGKRQTRSRRQPTPDLPPRMTRARSRSASVQLVEEPLPSRRMARGRGKAARMPAVQEEVIEPEEEEEEHAEEPEELQDVQEEEEEGVEVGSEKDAEAEEQEEEEIPSANSEEQAAALVADEEVGSNAPTEHAELDSDSDEDEVRVDKMLTPRPARRSAPIRPRTAQPPESSTRSLRSRPRIPTPSEEELFPSPNTSARAHIEEKDRQARAEPYVPPPGTRARKLRSRG
ncbi:hypothetical protein EVG20_g2912 [Dentipellis fragilis]|uniref:BRCT domain-containing protein n=1 Tax=Dentipellis fragilis TaxID=205917 RepID=A0A4Y9Z829_9AGAM|nr:hypothetical protein EVG20_g2912 [Dentipellis fragilis]